MTRSKTPCVNAVLTNSRSTPLLMTEAELIAHQLGHCTKAPLGLSGERLWQCPQSPKQLALHFVQAYDEKGEKMRVDLRPAIKDQGSASSSCTLSSCSFFLFSSSFSFFTFGGVVDELGFGETFVGSKCLVGPHV